MPPDDALHSESEPAGSCDAPIESDRTDAPASVLSSSGAPQKDAGTERSPRPFPAVVEIEDLDWLALREFAGGGDFRARIESIIERMEIFLDDPATPMLFDAYRGFAHDRAIHIASAGDSALWFVGDLHGDLLALEAALALIRSHPQYGSANARIIFLGDLFDDEGFGLEVLLQIFELVATNPATVCIIAGNHDEALVHDGTRFTSTVSPSDFSEFLNNHGTDQAIVRAGKLAIRLFQNAPRALFFPDGLLVSHGGFPLADLHPRLQEAGDWNAPYCLSDFVWARAHPTARKKLPNRFTRGSQFGHEDFAAFCSVASLLGRPVTHMVRGHDHVEERYQVYAAYKANPILTTVALSRRLSREFLGTHERFPTVALYTEGSLPQVFRLHIPAQLVREFYPEASEPPACEDAS
jgi:hypothetical protein